MCVGFGTGAGGEEVVSVDEVDEDECVGFVAGAGVTKANLGVGVEAVGVEELEVSLPSSQSSGLQIEGSAVIDSLAKSGWQQLLKKDVPCFPSQS